MPLAQLAYTFLAIVMIFSFIVSSGLASALSQSNTDALNNNWPIWVPCSTSGSSTSNSTPSGNLSSGQSIYILGDSITDLAQNSYISAFQQQGIAANIDASDGRTLDSGGTNGNKLSGMQAISADTSQIQSANAIVVALGTNGGNTASSIDQAISVIKSINSNAALYWVDTIGVNGQNFNATANQQANSAIYSQASKDNYQVISWFKAVDPNGNPQSPSTPEQDPNNYIDNSDGLGVHPTPAGIAALVNLVVSTVTGTSPQSSASSSSNPCCDSSSPNTANNVQITGNNPKDAFNFFVANGFTDFQAAGIVGNMMQESGVNPTSSDGAGNGGIAGFTADALSMASMEAWVTAHGEDPMSLQGQLDFVLYYITQEDPSVSAALKAATDVTSATLAWEDNFERCKGYDGSQGGPNAPGSCLQDQRIAYANQVLQQYGNGQGGGTSTGATGSCGNSTGGVSCSSGGTTPIGPNVAILCEAEKYSGIYYLFGGGHMSYSAWQQQCPESSIGGDSSSATKNSTIDNPGPCATDCSGLVSVAVDGAYNQSFSWSVSNGNGQMVGDGSQYWKSIPISQAQAGDIVTTTNPDGHVEIVVSVQGDTVNTFGSHSTGTKTGPITTSSSDWNAGAWRYTGPGSSGN